MAYFIQLKMQHACSLLAMTDLAVKEIAMDVGYPDSYHFSRLFKKTIGVSAQRVSGRPVSAPAK